MKNEMKFEEAVSAIEKMIENTNFEMEYSDCDGKDGFIYVVVKIKSSKD